MLLELPYTCHSFAQTGNSEVCWEKWTVIG